MKSKEKQNNNDKKKKNQNSSWLLSINWKRATPIGMLNSTGKAVHKELQATDGSLDGVEKSNPYGQTHQQLKK